MSLNSTLASITDSSPLPSGSEGHRSQTIRRDFSGVILTALAASVNISFIACHFALASTIQGIHRYARRRNPLTPRSAPDEAAHWQRSTEYWDRCPEE
jgi:hypothetical protein